MDYILFLLHACLLYFMILTNTPGTYWPVHIKGASCVSEELGKLMGTCTVLWFQDTSCCAPSRMNMQVAACAAAGDRWSIDGSFQSEATLCCKVWSQRMEALTGTQKAKWNWLSLLCVCVLVLLSTSMCLFSSIKFLLARNCLVKLLPAIPTLLHLWNIWRQTCLLKCLCSLWTTSPLFINTFTMIVPVWTATWT